MSQLTAVVSQLQQEKGKFPAQGSAAGTHYLENSSGRNVQNPNQEEAKSVTILRSGKEIDKSIPLKQNPAPPQEPVDAPRATPDIVDVPRKEVKDDEESPEVVVPAAAAPTTPTPSAVAVAPFPQRLAMKPKQSMNLPGGFADHGVHRSCGPEVLDDQTGCKSSPYSVDSVVARISPHH